MAKVAEKSISPEKISMFKNADDVMQRVLAESKREIEKLQGQRESLIIINGQLNDDLVRKQNQFEQWKRLEEQKMQDNRFKLNNEAIKREKALEWGEQDLFRRQEEMARREEIGRRIVEKEKQLNNDRIEIEKLRNSANGLMDEGSRKMSDAMSKFSQACAMEDKAKELFNKSSLINDGLLKREHAVEEKEKEIKLIQKNLEELRKIVDPKIDMIKEIEKTNILAKKELLEKEQEIDRKINEEMALLKNLELKEGKLKQREISLNQKEEELKRKALGVNV